MASHGSLLLRWHSGRLNLPETHRRSTYPWAVPAEVSPEGSCGRDGMFIVQRSQPGALSWLKPE